MAILEEACCRISVASLGETLDVADEGAVDRIASHSLEILSVTEDSDKNCEILTSIMPRCSQQS